MPLPYEVIPVDDEIILRQLKPKEGAELFKITDQNREHIGKWLEWVSSVEQLSDSIEFIKATIENRRTGSEYQYGIFYDGRLIGGAGIINLGKDPEIGYWLIEQAAGKGIMTRVAKALTHFGIETLKLPQIIIMAHPENIASNKVAEKCGYTLQGQKNLDRGFRNIWTKTLRS
jgi:ribosomal-protein-serine acetyltransferase